MKIGLIAAGIAAILALAPVGAFAADGPTFTVPKHNQPFICFFGANGPVGCVPFKHHGHKHHHHHEDHD